MTPDRWEIVVRIYNEALAMPAESRGSYIKSACEGDEAMENEILEMLPDSREDSRFLDPPNSTFDDETESYTGATIGGYRILNKLAKSAMGIVYRARKDGVEGRFAVKVLPAALAFSEDRLRRFELEIRVLRQLEHPGIVKIIDEGREGGAAYYVMEFVEGHDLARELNLLRRLAGGDDTSVPYLGNPRAEAYVGSVVSIMIQAADALAFAHQHEIVHRDIKPSNLLLDARSRRLRIVDFGLARDLGVDRMTRTGDVLGTLHYMSPEQARALHANLDHRTDIFSLGVVLYELLSLKKPFEGRTTLEVTKKIINDEPPSIRALNPHVPGDLATICSVALAKEPSERYENMAEFAEDLRRFYSHHAILARPVSFLQISRRFARRHRYALATGAAAIAIGAVLVWFTRATVLAGENASLRAEAESLIAKTPVERFETHQLKKFAGLVESLERKGLGEAADVAQWRGALNRSLQKLQDTFAVRMEDARRETSDFNERLLAAMEAESVLNQIAAVDPETARTLGGRQSLGARIRVDAVDVKNQKSAARVYSSMINPFNCEVSERIPIGDAPLEAALPPGYHRVIVAFEQGGAREYTVNSAFVPETHNIHAVHRDDETNILSGMTRFEGGAYDFGSARGLMNYKNRKTRLDPYYLDRTEVSNAQYKQFMDATGHAAPDIWKYIKDAGAFMKQYGNRPVVGMTWYDANDYAAWAGKRLPSLAEWLFAAGGPKHRPFPYSDDAAAPVLGNVTNPSPHGHDFDASEMWNYYLQYSEAVDSRPEARTPEGIYHMFGNVSEFTESMVVTANGRGAEPSRRMLDRFVVGGSWYAVNIRFNIYNLTFTGLGPEDATWEFGFRCAKSAE